MVVTRLRLRSHLPNLNMSVATSCLDAVSSLSSSHGSDATFFLVIISVRHDSGTTVSHKY